jgi:GNAT superfamily N-acetyltransferase
MDLLEYSAAVDAEEIDLALANPPVVLRSSRNKFVAQLVTSSAEFEKVTAIRRAVFCEECGYDEDNEFDGNDFCAAHILLKLDSVAVASARIRFFADFVLLERFSVLPAFRHSLAAQHLSRACLTYAAGKGYRRVFGVVRDRFVNFWLRMGAAVREDIGPMTLGQYQYFPVELPIPQKYSAGQSMGDVEWLLSREADSFLPPPPAGLLQAMTGAPQHSFAH